METLLYAEGVKTLTIKDIPDKTLQGFKAFAALSGKSMNQLIIEYMKEKAEQVQLKDK